MSSGKLLLSFPEIQAAYAERSVVTYPLTLDKRPAVRGYHRIGANYSSQLVLKFPEAMAAGFLAGWRNRVTVIDIDSVDERLVAEIEAEFGPSPLHVLTPSGGRHLYFRHNGEARRIRMLPDVDMLGGGNVVAAGSRTPKGRYEIERGSLDDLERLPRMTAPKRQPEQRVPEGKRNDALHRYLQSMAGHCDDLAALMDAARTWVEQRAAGSLPDAEVVRTAASVWRFRGGRKLFMQHIIEGPAFPKLMADPEVWTVCSFLMIEQGPDAQFMIADGLGEARGWPRRMVPKARKALLDLKIIEQVRRPGNGLAALYRWKAPADS